MNIYPPMSVQSMSDVKTFRDLSFRDTFDIVNVSKQIGMNVNSKPTLQNAQEFIQLVGRINTSIKNRPFWRFLLDIITLQFIKIIMLNRVLPTLIQNIKNITGITVPIAAHFNSSWEDTSQWKGELLERAWSLFQADCFKNTHQNVPNWEVTAERVDSYFQEAMHRLGAGENVPVPIYYHASASAVDLIAEGSILKQSDSGVQGPGVYFSSKDECSQRYGYYTFAMDPSQVESYNATYRLGDHMGRTNEERGLWMCATNKNIPLETNKVAYVIVPDDGNATVDKINKFWNNGNFFVKIITRDAADWIRHYIEAVHIHSVPDQWTHYDSYPTSRAATGLKHIVAN